MAQISCRDVTLGYEGRAVIEGLTFCVERGAYLCIVGENGSGKSTLIKALLGLKAPVKGEISMGDGMRANEIGYLPQQTQAQRDFPASVWEIILSGCLNRCGLRPYYNRAEKELAMDAMRELGILPLKNACYRDLSGGQQQRVLLSRALCATRTMLLLDEPVAGLDPVATHEMYALIDKLHGAGITIVMVSHDISAAVHYASHILHLGGASYFFGTTEEYLHSESGRTFAAWTEGAQNG